jgi:hypothetical protein
MSNVVVFVKIHGALGDFAIVIEESSGIARSYRSCRVSRRISSNVSLTILTDVALSLVWAKVGGVAGLNVVAGPILLALCGLRLG